MTISVSCSCGRVYRVGEERAGRRARCRACGHSISIPAPVEPRPATPPTPPFGLLDVLGLALALVGVALLLAALATHSSIRQDERERMDSAVRQREAQNRIVRLASGALSAPAPLKEPEKADRSGVYLMAAVGALLLCTSVLYWAIAAHRPPPTQRL